MIKRYLPFLHENRSAKYAWSNKKHLFQGRPRLVPWHFTNKASPVLMALKWRIVFLSAESERVQIRNAICNAAEWPNPSSQPIWRTKKRDKTVWSDTKFTIAKALCRASTIRPSELKIRSTLLCRSTLENNSLKIASCWIQTKFSLVESKMKHREAVKKEGKIDRCSCSPLSMCRQYR